MFWKGGLSDHQYGGRDLRKFSVDHERVGHGVGLLCWLFGDSVIFNGLVRKNKMVPEDVGENCHASFHIVHMYIGKYLPKYLDTANIEHCTYNK